MRNNRGPSQRKGIGPAVELRFTEVTARDNEAPEAMIKRFTKRVRNDGVLEEFMDRRFFVKPSVLRRQKRANSTFRSRPQ